MNEDIGYIKMDKYYYLEDTKNLHLFRIMENENIVLNLIKQNLSTEEILKKLRNEFGLSIQKDKVQKFKNRLLKLGILIRTTDRKETTKIRSFRKNILHLHFPILDPSGLLNSLTRSKAFGYVFTFPFLLIALFIILIGILIFSHNKEILLDFSYLLQNPRCIPIFIFIFLLSSSLHEIAHGIVCSYYGGKVKEMGIGIFYFIPSFYCSTHRVWLFKKKSQKIFTYLSGLFMDFLIGSLLVILYGLFPKSNAILLSSKLLVLSVIIRTIFAINPFIESDFYRILTHLFNIANLRSKAFLTIYNLISGKNKNVEILTNRERIPSILYGISFLIFWIIVLSFSLFSTKHFYIIK